MIIIIDNVFNNNYFLHAACINELTLEGDGLLCYQCTSNSTIDCGDLMIHLGGIEPQSCDHVFEAQYCIKMTGTYCIFSFEIFISFNRL